MHRTVRRAVVAAATLTLLTAAIATADEVRGDSDVLSAGFQSNRDLGAVAPGTEIDVPVAFTLSCLNTEHVDPGQSVVIEAGSVQVPDGGALAFDPVTLGPVPAAWPADADGCSGQPPLTTTGTVRVTAPATPGRHDYSQFFIKSLTPVGSNDEYALTNLTVAGFTLTVVDNTPPTLHLPGDLTVEGNTTGGATVTYAAAATDLEDDPDPTPDCGPASGDVFPLGATTVDCRVTDRGGLTDGGSFTVTVVDTTAPVLHGIPADLRLTTTDPAGATLAYDLPTATDVVDAAPSVVCAPAPGGHAPVGDSTVTCTARDASGNEASIAFAVHVSLLAARWDEPVGAPATISANAGRTIPVKVELFRDGVEVEQGSVRVLVIDADSAARATLDLAWNTGRWIGHLDTATLAGGTYRVVARLDGSAAGAFRLDLRGSSPTATGTKGSSWNSAAGR